MKQPMPLVSVIMPINSGSATVEKAIESITTQIYTRWELFLVYEYLSPKLTRLITRLKKHFPTRIRTITYTTSQTSHDGMNDALALSKGSYIAFTDSETVSHKHRLAKQIAHLSTHPLYILVSSFYKTGMIQSRMKPVKLPTTHEAIVTALSVSNPIMLSTCMIRRAMLPTSTFLFHGSVDHKRVYYTFFELLNYGRFAILPEYLQEKYIPKPEMSLAQWRTELYHQWTVRMKAMRIQRFTFPIFSFPRLIPQILALMIPTAFYATIDMLYARRPFTIAKST